VHVVKCARCIDTEIPGLGWCSMGRTLAIGTFVLLNGALACADRAPSDEERIAPLVAARRVALRGIMFFFFSNGIGVAGSILISILLSLLLLYACSH
jgi:hypothetical protein